MLSPALSDSSSIYSPSRLHPASGDLSDLASSPPYLRAATGTWLPHTNSSSSFSKMFFPRPLFSTPSSKSYLMLSSPQIQLLSMISTTCSRLGKLSATCYHFGSIWLTPNDPSPATINRYLNLLYSFVHRSN
jgi:hypothetical protein